MIASEQTNISSTLPVHLLFPTAVSLITPFPKERVPWGTLRGILQQLLSIQMGNTTSVILKAWSADQQLQHTLELVRNANSQTHSRPIKSETLWVGPSNVFLTSLQVILTHAKIWEPCSSWLKLHFREWISLLSLLWTELYLLRILMWKP